MSQKKKFSKHIDMGSSFEDLVATSPTVKTNFKSDKRFGLQNLLNFRVSHLMRDDISFFGFLGMHAKEGYSISHPVRTGLHACACMHAFGD